MSFEGLGEAFVDVRLRFDPQQASRQLQGDLAKPLNDVTSKSFDDAGKKAGEKFGKSAGSSIGTALKVIGGAAAARAAFGFVQAGVDSLARLDKLQAQSQAVIKSTGGAAGVSAKQVREYGDQIEKLTSIESEQVQEAQNLLLTFTNVQNKAGAGNDIFTQATKVMTDMSVAMGTDVKAGAIQLGKALNDPIAGITALTRVGVTFTQQQKDQIAAMTQAGNVAGAQKIILAELNKEFGGSAEALGDTLQGRLAQFNNKVGDVQEQVAGALLPALEGTVQVLGGMADVLSQVDPRVIQVGAGLVALIAGLVVVNKVAGAVRGLRADLEGAGRAGQFASAGLGTMAKAGLVIGTILTVKQGLDALNSALTKTDFNMKSVAAASQNELNEAVARQADTMEKAGLTQKVFNKLLEDSPVQAERFIVALQAAGINTAKYEAALKTEKAELKAVAVDQKKVSEITADATTETELNTKATEEAERVLKNLISAREREAQVMADALRGTNDAWRASIQLASAEDQVREGQERINQLNTEGKGKTQEMTEATRDLLNSYISASETAVDYANATRAAHGEAKLSTFEAVSVQVQELDKLIKTLDRKSPLRKQLQEYKEELLNVPNQVATELRLKVPEGFEVEVHVGKVTVRQHGGPLAGGQMALVGETGPELFVPRTNGEVLNNATTERLLRALSGAGRGVDRSLNVAPGAIQVVSDSPVDAAHAVLRRLTTYQWLAGRG